MDKIEELLTRGVANIIPKKEELKNLLNSGKKLNIYLGIDPTATKIHLGHAVPLRKLQAFAERKHNVTFLIGDFTALIGDTSDKDTERPVLTSKEIEENFQTYKKQAEKIVDFSLSNVSVVHNSEWLSKLDFKKVVELAQQFDFGEFASRELIAKRLKEGKHVGLHEALYPIMQGYDSYKLDTDIQIGGTDQTFNMQAGRTLQKKWRNKESFVLAMEFLTGTDGRKMSKSWGNAIWLEDTPRDMYGKIMRMNDDVIIEYYKLATCLDMDAVNHIEEDLKNGQDPMHAKHMLAQQIVGEFYGKDTATDEHEYFKHVVQNKEMPDDVPTVTEKDLEKVSLSDAIKEGRWITDVLVALNLAPSASEAKRLVQQGAVSVDGEKILDSKQLIKLEDNMILKVGKRNYVRIVIG